MQITSFSALVRSAGDASHPQALSSLVSRKPPATIVKKTHVSIDNDDALSFVRWRAWSPEPLLRSINTPGIEMYERIFYFSGIVIVTFSFRTVLDFIYLACPSQQCEDIFF